MSYLFEASVFDLDGIITKTAVLHSQAWKATFDEYLHLLEKRDGKLFKEFTYKDDYLPYVDGKPRYEGVKSFLESRDIHIPFGEALDKSANETCCGIGNRKNEFFREILEEKGPEIYPSTIMLIKEMKELSIRIGVASSSKNCEFIINSAHISDLFETRIDGVNAVSYGLKGKPEADIFIKAASNIGTHPDKTIVFEDATSGVLAGRNGAFGLVIGVAREDNILDLFENGADLVVNDLEELSMETLNRWFGIAPFNFFENYEDINSLKADALTALNIRVNPFYKQSIKTLLDHGKKTVFLINIDYILDVFPGVLSELMNIMGSLVKTHDVILMTSKENKIREIFKNLNVKLFPIEKQDTDNNYHLVMRKIMDNFHLSFIDTFPLVIGGMGDDEKSFRFVKTRGLTVLVTDSNLLQSSADYYVNTTEIIKLLNVFSEYAGGNCG